MLAPVDALDFTTVREALDISDYVLSKHVRILVDAGYLSTSKKPHATRTRTRTWLSLTDTGRSALNGHLAELRRIAATATVWPPPSSVS
jgi:DNA-binding MarR family transcriptional regulator